MNVLLIGNSYTYYNDMPKLLQALCDENGKQVRVYSVTKGGRKLWENLNPEDETTVELHTLLSRVSMDVCFLQEHSILPITKYEQFRQGVKGLCRELSPFVSRFVLYETWGRKEGNAFLAQSGLTNQTMTEQLIGAYARLAEELSLEVSHAGTHFYRVHSSHAELALYDPDLTHPGYFGSCLVAMTHYHALFGVFPEKFQSLSLPSGTAEIFRRAIIGNP